MAAGTPIIAYNTGGVLESITKDTGVFFDSPTPESLIKAIDKFENRNFDTEKLYKRANKYSKKSFVENINLVINSHCG
jgi:glycosyltransferase involved in cell wall biosynthesis